MIDKITSFFSHQKRKIIIPLYFTEEKNESISIEITPDKTISEIYLENINQISVIQAKIFQKKQDIISKNNFCFTLFSSQNPYIRIKQKNSSIPYKKLILKNLIDNYSLFYLANNNYYNDNKNNVIHRRLNNLTKNKSQEESNYDKTLSDETYLINFVSPNNKIIDGEIEKFSFSQKMFNKIFIYIDSNKLMYKEISPKEKKSLQNLWNVIPLSNISSLENNISDNIDSPYIDIDKYKDRLFMIKTFNNEKLLLKANDKNDKEIWLNHLKDIIEKVRMDKIFFKFNKDINDISKNIYMNTLKFICKLIGIKGIIRYNISRKCFFENYKNIFLEKIVECCVKYKFNVIKKSNAKALEEIKYLGQILDIDKIQKNIQFVEEKEKKILNDILDEETKAKISNILNIKNFNERSFSFIILDLNLLNNLLNNIINKFLIKEHKKIIYQKQILFLNCFKKIAAAQFCKNNHFNCNKMNVLFEENMNINIPPDEFPDLNELI